MSWDARLGVANERLIPIKDPKEVQIGHLGHQLTKIVTSLYDYEEWEVVDQLKRNIYFFSRATSDIPGIDTRVVCHCLSVNPFVRQVSQTKRKVGKEKIVSINKEVSNLGSPDFIIKVKYPTWLASVVLIKKASNKWPCVWISSTLMNLVPITFIPC